MSFEWSNFINYNNEIGKLFNNPLLSDVKFEFPNNNVIHAHSFVLSMRGKEFFHAFQDSIGIKKLMPIDDISYDAFYNFMKCIYTLDDIKVSDSNCWEYLKISHRYGIPDMEQKCYKLIKNNMTVSTVCWILQKTIDVDGIEKSLQISALNFIDHNLSYILEQESFYSINIKTLHKILEWPYSHSSATEMDIFKAVMKWAGMACKRQQIEPSAAAKKSILGNTYKLIRFPSMTAKEFSECIQFEPNFLGENEVTAIFMNISTKCENNLGFLDYKRINVGTSQNLVITNLQPTIKLPATTKFSTQFTVTESIKITGLSHTSPSGNGTIRILSSENVQLISKSWTNVKDEYCVRSVSPAVNMEKGKRYEILFEFENEANDIKGFKSNYNLPLKIIGSDGLIFYFTKLSPNINMLFYNREKSGGQSSNRSVLGLFSF